MITVGIIEDDPILRKNLEVFLSTQLDTSISFSVNSVEQFLQGRNSFVEPLVVFCDIGLPGISGKDGITYIHQIWSEVYVVVITGSEDDDLIYNCIQKGANGYIMKPFKLDDILSHVTIIRNGGTLLSPKVAAKLFKHIQKQNTSISIDSFGLTTREKQVVEELLKGMTYKEIGNILAISATTVNDHLKNVYKKVGVRTKSELMRLILKT